MIPLHIHTINISKYINNNYVRQLIVKYLIKLSYYMKFILSHTHPLPFKYLIHFCVDNNTLTKTSFRIFVSKGHCATKCKYILIFQRIAQSSIIIIYCLYPRPKKKLQ